MAEPIKGFAFPAVASEIAAVKERPAVSLDQESIGIKGGMVHQVGSDADIANREGLPGFKIVGVVDGPFLVGEEIGELNQLVGCFAEIDIAVRVDVVDQAVMVLMGVG